MKFNFKIQPFQTEAVDSVVRVFDGQAKHDPVSYRRCLRGADRHVDRKGRHPTDARDARKRRPDFRACNRDNKGIFSQKPAAYSFRRYELAHRFFAGHYRDVLRVCALCVLYTDQNLLWF